MAGAEGEGWHQIVQIPWTRPLPRRCRKKPAEKMRGFHMCKYKMLIFLLTELEKKKRKRVPHLIVIGEKSSSVFYGILWYENIMFLIASFFINDPERSVM